MSGGGMRDAGAVLAPATERGAAERAAAAWRPPGPVDLARLGGEAAERLPDAIRAAIGPLAVLVSETPDRRSLRRFEIGDPYSLLGRFDAADGRRQARLTLYRRPLLDYWAECGEPLGAVIARIVQVELARR